MKKVLLIIIICLFLCGCNNKGASNERYEELEKKYNELVERYDTTKEEKYLSKYLSSNFNLQSSRMNKYKILEFYLDVSDGSDSGVVGIIDLMHEDWFDYDYILMYGYSGGYIVGITQFDGKTGRTMTIFKDVD